MTTSVSERPLTEVLAALRSDRRGDALRLLLGAWRATRSATLGRLVGALSADLRRSLPAIQGATRNAFHEAWLVIAARRNAADVPRLVAGLEHPPWKRFAERVTALSLFEPHPEIALALADFVERMPTATSVPDSAWRLALKLIRDFGDARCVEPLRARAGAINNPSLVEQELVRPLARRVAEALAQRTEPSLPPMDVAAVDAELGRLARAAPAPEEELALPASGDATFEAGLLAAVYAAPEDDTPRRVYADWLLEREDPRGHFINAQLALREGRAKTKLTKLASQLLNANEARWLEPLREVIHPGSAEFERGFLARCRTAVRTPTQAARLAASPAWNTVTELVDPSGHVLHAAPLTGLRALGPLEPGAAAALSARVMPFPALRTLRLSAGELTDFEARQFARAKAFPVLERLELLPQDNLQWLAGTRLGARLRHVAILHLSTDLLRWVALFQRLPGLERLTVGRAFECRRAAGQVALRIDTDTCGRGVFVDLARVGQGLPGFVTAVELVSRSGPPTPFALSVAEAVGPWARVSFADRHPALPR